LEQRQEFIQEWMERKRPVSELSRVYGISRKTAYKWIDRFEEKGRAGLAEQSRAPHHSPQQIHPKMAAAIVAERQQHPTWGARKIVESLRRREPAKTWPAASSIGELLKREGLIQSRRVRRKTPPYSEPLKHAQAANQVWCVDFKGWFYCGNGERCDPLTVSDAYSRYLLRCRATEKTDGAHVRNLMEAIFREYGLPEAIRSDNGSPFASRAPGGLSRLSMRWLQLGIRHERIEPGCPQQNGRHERMHRTLQEETANPPARSRSRQQQAFVEFERVYNQERPHEALGWKRPVELDRAGDTRRGCRSWSIRGVRICGGSRSKAV
jgi:transposase InsO family protein